MTSGSSGCPGGRVLAGVNVVTRATSPAARHLLKGSWDGELCAGHVRDSWGLRGVSGRFGGAQISPSVRGRW